QRAPLPPPKIVEDEPHYKVEKVINSHMFWGKLQYHVLWKNYGYEDASWEPRENILSAPGQICNFHHANPDTTCHICWGVLHLSPAAFAAASCIGAM
ncbi:hypothetical protein DXG03_004552, partial [Asterophora parasitica]